MSADSLYLAAVRATYPALTIATARRIDTASQFNDVLLVNDSLILRFPRNATAAAALTHEVAVLRRLQGRLPLPVPNPTLLATDPATGAVRWMGYARIPGEPLWEDDRAALGDDDQAATARQLAGFLHALHGLPLAEVAPELPVRPAADVWDSLFAAFAAELYPFMRPAARAACDTLRRDIVTDLARTPPPPVLIHGDFGGGNILYDPATRRVTGVIDFGAVAGGDPAVDIAAFGGEQWLGDAPRVYPDLAALLPRARRYRATFALQQALWALRDGDAEAFEDGIAEYR